ncbi:MAG TPA: hypothetical protein VNM15_09605 [Candidatus Binatia bacterium]|nr:hypothetical protein [Candidatus Binatia bacterium]
MAEGRIVLSSLVVASLLGAAAASLASTRNQAVLFEGPEAFARGYVRAVQARDFLEAYRYLSAADRRLRDAHQYARQRGAFVGFALEAARKLAAFSDIQLILKRLATDRIQAVPKVRMPEPKRIAPLVKSWDMRQLNSLGPAERAQTLDALERTLRDGALPMIDIVEAPIDLVREGEEWRVFLNWAAGVQLQLALSLSQAPEIEATLSKIGVVVQPGELFDISLRIKNRSSHRNAVRIAHLIEPHKLSNFLDLVECGFIRPVILEPGIERHFDARYLILESLPEGVRQLNLTYEFAILKFQR